MSSTQTIPVSGPFTVNHALGSSNLIVAVWVGGQLLPGNSYRVNISDPNNISVDVEGYDGQMANVVVLAG